MSLLMTQLQQFVETRSVVDLYRERLSKEGLMGVIIGVSEYVILLRRIDEQYECDGVTAVRPGDVTRVRAHDRELLMVGEMLVYDEVCPPLDDVCLVELSAAMTVLGRRYGAVTLYVEALDPALALSGEPDEIDDNFLVLRQWGTARTLDKYKTLLRLNEITRVDSGTKYLQCLARAYSLTK
ncbi:hypothetical protein WMF31_41795 [Sorangium sp. So ce1036]|uniref:hypothetical protein n=1 Tax=Sorangium sp. So ce1036 TaxID=3133328 RepID=UPI003EFF36C6